MKKRILFVDDERPALEGLQRMLRPMREEWEMVFVESGAQALVLMEEMPFDVVISDMRMPNMNGAELLAAVLKRFPKTIRLILSGHGDHDLVLKCVGSTHQYLSKPCVPGELKAAITRASGLEHSLRSGEIRQLVSRLDRLPSIPSLYIKIVEKLQDPEVGVDEIGIIVAQDLAMTAKILKLVNSAFFGLGRQISSAAEAVSHLGLDTIKALVLSIDAFSQFEPPKLGSFSIDSLWMHSQNVAGLAKEISRMENASHELLEEAFVAGLLHDTGKLILACNFPDAYNEILDAVRGGSLAHLEAETRTFGANHAEVGGYLLGLWGLPVPVVEAITLHHHPGEGHHFAWSPLAAVHVANGLMNAQRDRRDGSHAEELDLDYLGKLGLGHRLESWRAASRIGLHSKQ